MEFANTLWLWTNKPLGGWKRLILVFEKEREAGDGDVDSGDVSEEEDSVDDSDGEWFLSGSDSD